MKDTLQLTIRSATNADVEAVRELVFGVLREYGLEPDPDGLDLDLDDIESSYMDRGGAFDVLVDAENAIVGTVGLYPIDTATVELRKMYFLKEIRGKGLGKRLLKITLAKAKEHGFDRVTLETASVLKEAIGLYRSFGFRDLPGSHADRCDRSFYLDL